MNVTLDNTDSSITYQGEWESPSRHKSSLDYSGNHAYSSDPSANATLTFAGVAVYYLVPRWPYPVTTQLSLDGGPGIVVNLTDPNASPTDGGSESTVSSVAWSVSGLSNTTHHLVLTMAPSGNSRRGTGGA
ncbi:hypothetical protein B0H14DRAFT_2412634 [Mycena olivaceomarginata]|nr:hypothetical protein B0H14DRAFT_2412634 [Mycena olivaceomarginata]